MSYLMQRELDELDTIIIELTEENLDLKRHIYELNLVINKHKKMTDS